MNMLTEQQLEKLTIQRLVNIRKKIAPILGRMAVDVKDGHYTEKDPWVAQLKDYDALLRRVMEKREHVVRPEHRMWRTLIRIEHVGSREVSLVIPAWDSQEVVKVKLAHIPEPVKSLLKPEKRLHARVNTGAERHQDLHFADWEKE